ncbi:MAG TPA: hypothetical protein VK629_17600 [Steroidobacteraceae bacterium]|nr:hypothetical protein [Steroidobacteraceae bacterium]
MNQYANLSGNSGVVNYDLRDKSIVIQFQDGWKYEYTTESAGELEVAKLKRLARTGAGLSTYISQQVRDKYAHKFR